MQLITAQSIAGALVDSVTAPQANLPRIMPAPILNEEMLELVEHGEGF